MGQNLVNPKEYRRAVLAYHALLVVIALTVVVLFFAAFFLTSGYLLSVIIAAAYSALLTWRDGFAQGDSLIFGDARIAAIPFQGEHIGSIHLRSVRAAENQGCDATDLPLG